MPELRRYRRKENALVSAVRLDLDTEGFTYEKWGGIQRCKPGDWVVNNAGETYTIDADVFASTYSEVSPGLYRKHAQIWAERAEAAGVIPTLEGSTAYEAGDMLVYTDPSRSRGYAVAAGKFATLYEPVDS